MIIDAPQKIKKLKERVDILEVKKNDLYKRLELLKLTSEEPSIEDIDAFEKYNIDDFTSHKIMKEISNIISKKIKLMDEIGELEKDDLFKEKYEIRKYMHGPRVFTSILDTDCYWQSIVLYYLKMITVLQVMHRESDLTEKLQKKIEFIIWRISNTKQIIGTLEDGQKEEAKLLIAQFTLAKEFLRKVLAESKEEY